MKTILLSAGSAMMMLAAVATQVPADAKGCLKGAAVGGVGGHMAGHHGLVGAGVGCAVGHHMANKKAAQSANPPS